MFIPCCATHRADSRPPAPHQMRSDSLCVRLDRQQPAHPRVLRIRTRHSLAGDRPAKQLRMRPRQLAARLALRVGIPKRFRAVQHRLRRAAATALIDLTQMPQLSQTRLFAASF
jgi:hypothetical protein